MPTDEAPPPATQVKYSRYRSLRNSARQSSVSSSSTEQNDAKTATVQRSMSRYHRPRGTTLTLSPSPPSPYHSATDSSLHTIDVKRKDGNHLPSSAIREANDGARHTKLGLDDNANNTMRRRADLETKKATPRLIPIGQQQDQYAEGDSLEMNALLAEQKRKDLERLELELSTAAMKSVSSPKSSIIPDKFGTSLLRKFDSHKKSTSKSSVSAVPGPTSNGASQKLPNSGGDVFSRIDAPVSAVNSGERRILVRYKQSSINLPVTPETTTVDLVYSAVNDLSQAITPSATILLESYNKLGLERRIRRYERIRDVMNSWDRDTQNAVVLQPSDSPNHDQDLELSAVPKKQPGDLTVQMYYSRNPGSWDKRYVTLLSSGQIFASKKPGAKVTDKNITTICHLTDFDIYTFATEQARRKVNPPKQRCYAIKSQQKTTLFLSTENFVHFFSTDDIRLAEKWYDSIQTWRSWYLVNMKGAGRTQDAPASSGGPKVTGTRTVGSIADENAPNLTGTPKPFFEQDGVENGIDEEDENRPRQIPFHLRNQLPSSSNPPDSHRRNYSLATVSRQSRSGTADDSLDLDNTGNGATFAPSGLLGRTYTQRQKGQRDRDSSLQRGPFTSGPSLLNNISTAESSRPKSSSGASNKSTHSPRRSVSLRPRTASHADKRPPPVPLIDLTPKFVEAPQWNKDGKGHGVAAPSGMPLVEVATTKQAGLGLGPQGAVFRREN